MPVEERRFPSVEAAAQALADDLAETMREAIAIRGCGLLAVSGGRTPRHVFRRLVDADVTWDCVTLTLTDDRWVPPGHPESNEGLVRTHLLQGPPASATLVPLFGGEASPEAGQAACERRLDTLVLPFDAVYLGMGPDGHFASLFPGEPAVDVRDCRCIAIPGKGSRLPRMSLTAATLLAARRLFLLFGGSEKGATYLEAMQPGSHHDIPLRMVLSQENVPVTVLRAP
ncbi:6-phosphogluconolactonase [Gemmatimonadota bacterium]